MPPTKQSSYGIMRSQIRTGDFLAFVGRAGLFSWAIRTFTGIPTHIAPVAWVEDADGDPRVVLVEAIEGKGVVKTYASERVSDYKGEVYLLRIDPLISFDPARASKFLMSAIGQRYSMINALLSGPSQWFRIPGRDRKNALFCSKLAHQVLRMSGVNPSWWGKDMSPTPRQFIKLAIWKEFVQLHGEPRPLS